MSSNGSSNGLRVIVVGAGIAGLAAAIAMRGEGREVTVLESSSSKEEVGAAIHLAPNATKLIQRWGLDIKKEARATVCRQYVENNLAAGHEVRVPLDTEKAFGAPWLFQHRVDLHTALRKYAEGSGPAGAPAVVKTGCRVSSVDCEAGKVTTTDGQTFEADIIIGADGIKSKVRDAILGEGVIAKPSGHSAYRCLIPAEDLQDIEEVKEILSVDESKLKITVQGDRRTVMYPCRMATILNIVAITPDTHLKEESKESWKADGNTADLVAAFEGFPEWITKTLSRVEKPGLYQLRDQEPLSTWVKGRAILIGDAAHAMLPHQGQGAGQSIEDAEAIGALFEGFEGPATLEKVNKVLQDIFDARIGRASLVQAFSRQQAMPVDGKQKVALNAQQFVGYNFSYLGVKEWIARPKEQPPKQDAEAAPKLPPAGAAV